MDHYVLIKMSDSEYIQGKTFTQMKFYYEASGFRIKDISWHREFNRWFEEISDLIRIDFHTEEDKVLWMLTYQ